VDSVTPLAEYIAERYAGEGVGIASILRDADADRALGRPGAGVLHRRLDPAVANHERQTVIRAALTELLKAARAVYSGTGGESASGPNLFTIARPGEELAALTARHQAVLLAEHPDTYLTVVLNSLHGPDGKQPPLPAFQLARADLRLRQEWYPDGLPALDAPLLAGPQTARFQGYVAALSDAVWTYAGLMNDPRALRRHLEGRALPCARATYAITVAGTDYEVEEGLDRAALLRTRRGAPPRWRAPLWYPVPADPSQPGPLYALTTERDPVTRRDTHVIGTAQLTLRELAHCRLPALPDSRPRCCPELQDQALFIRSRTRPRLVRFHRQTEPFNFRPALSVDFSGHQAAARRLDPDRSGTPLHLGGCLIPSPRNPEENTAGPWTGWAVWVDEENHGRAWEQIRQRDLIGIAGQSRLLERRTGILRYDDAGDPGERPAQPSPAEVQGIITPLLSYVYTTRLLGM
jgi:hypothetical protein